MELGYKIITTTKTLASIQGCNLDTVIELVLIGTLSFEKTSYIPNITRKWV